ncbi:amiloride-sensitive sodium channel subunit alpha-like [Physella acuta]|uniref:amiloride-sensitive sodium channel subunit alpha-like n=1 Tax=Physella acuta TaxID=109671 RepID=UPI0027DBB703|nr:amiloride-sensitive sodium channel subunit alpha-like [Physella acuta]
MIMIMKRSVDITTEKILSNGDSPHIVELISYEQNIQVMLDHITRPEKDFTEVRIDDEKEEVKAVKRITHKDDNKDDKIDDVTFANRDARTVAKVDPTKSHNKFYRIFYKYAKRASFNGMVFILKSQNPIVKALWTLLVLAAAGASIFHLFYLFSNFYEFQKYSKVNLKFSSLQFPAVTVCNVNMMRFSKIANASKAVKNLFAQDNDYTATTTDEPDLKDSGLLKWVAEREQALCTYCKYCWDQGEGQNSSLYEFDDYFTYVYNKQPLAFKQIVSPQYGNCYTIENPDFISRKSGAASGLELILSLETEDYSPVTTSSRGARVIIHEPQTIPFQDENDIAISPGMHTMIGLRQVKINRMGAPYAPCEPGEEFLRNNGYKYTRNLCQKMCEDQHIRTTCRCYEYEVDFNTTRKENLQDHVGQCENKSVIGQN